MNNQQAPRKSPAASVRVQEAKRGPHQVTNKEFVEWIKEVEGDASRREQRPARRRMPQKSKQGNPDRF
jgi:hypothetical protein